MRRFVSALGAGALFAGALVLGVVMQPAELLAATCTTAGFGGSDISGNVIANNGCEVGSNNNDSEAQVNTDNMFGINTWDFAEKWNPAWSQGDEDIDIGLELTGTSLAGNWSINDVWATYGTIMLVFVDGAGVPENYVGYLLVPGDTSGTFTSPFANTINGNPKEISHVSAYVVPIPGAVWLFGSGVLGLLGLGYTRRRQAAA